MYKTDKSASDTIRNMRFPLIVMIVLLHTFILGESIMGKVYVTKEAYPHFEIFEHIIKVDFGEVAIPVFFLLSGFLFFINIDNWDFKAFLNKLTRRISSLLIPYIIWNSIFILFVFILQQFHPEWMPEKKMVSKFTLSDWADAYWNLSQGLIPLWYVRDLMVISLFTPLIHFVIKKTGPLLPVLLGGIFVFNWFNYMPGLGTRCSLFFVTGAYWGIKKKNFFAMFDRWLLALLTIYIALVAIDTYYWRISSYPVWINRLVLLCGVISLLAFAYRLTTRFHLQLPALLAEASFFVFVFHMFVIYIPGKFWATFLPVNGFTIYLMQLLIPISVGFACVGVYFIGKKIMPQLTRIAVGNR